MTTKPTTIISATTAHDREVREYRPVSFAGDSVLEPRMRAQKKLSAIAALENTMMICWRIWIHRNNIIWNDKFGSVQQVLNSAGQFLYQWQVAKKQVYYVDEDVHRLAHGAVSWERPKFGWVKCNVDAAIFESQRRFGLGCVLRNSDGCVLAARCVGRPGMFGAGEAEALSIREALSWLKKLQFPCVVVEMDCLQVFQALTEGFSGPNGFGLMIEECRALAL